MTSRYCSAPLSAAYCSTESTEPIGAGAAIRGPGQTKERPIPYGVCATKRTDRSAAACRCVVPADVPDEAPLRTPATVSIAPVLLVNFIGSLGFSIVIPFLVFLVQRWGGNALMYGLVACTYPALQLVGAPILGRWSDSAGRRRVLLISQLGTLCSWLVFAVAFMMPERILFESDALTLTIPLVVVFLARALDGLTGGNVSVANAYLADISTDENRSRHFGWMAATANTGFIIGPALAGLLGSTKYGELLPVLLAAAISAIAALIIAFRLPESNPCAARDGRAGQTLRWTLGQEPRDCMEARTGHQWIEIVSQPDVPMMLVLYGLIFLAFNLFYAAFPNHAADGLGWNVAQTGIFFTLLSAGMVIVQGPVLAWLTPRVRASTRVIAGGLVMGLCFATLVVRYDLAVFGAALLFAVGNGIMWPSYMALLARIGTPTVQGSIQGIAGSVGGLASIVGLVGGGLLYSAIGEQTFVVAGAIIVVAAIVARRLRRIA